jgi:hypothetical protein
MTEINISDAPAVAKVECIRNNAGQLTSYGSLLSASLLENL